MRRLFPLVLQAVLKEVNIDDWFFGVSAVGAEGYESPVVFPGSPGSWAHEVTPPAATQAR